MLVGSCSWTVEQTKLQLLPMRAVQTSTQITCCVKPLSATCLQHHHKVRQYTTL